MEKFDLNMVSRDLFTVFQLFHKNIMNFQDSDLNSEGLSRSNYEVMFVLDDVGKVTMTDIAKALFLSKPYITAQIDKLESCGLVKRMPDKDDRRVINILLTEKGKEFIKRHREVLEERIKSKILSLSEGELSELSLALQTLKNLISKVEPK